MQQSASNAPAWNDEYRKGGIPSSIRESPSGAVRTFTQFLAIHDVRRGYAVDIGCGTGRNALYLQSIGYKVLAMDFASDVVQRLQERIDNDAMLQGKVTVVCQDVINRWPAEDGQFDIAVDTFCFKHQIVRQNITIYKQELSRTLKHGGYFLLTLAGIDDGYYGPLLESSPERERNVIIDPENGIASILYSKEKIIELFEDYQLREYEHKATPSEMHGAVYPRSTHLFIFQKT